MSEYIKEANSFFSTFDRPPSPFGIGVGGEGFKKITTLNNDISQFNI
jgi:hypothetical protein